MSDLETALSSPSNSLIGAGSLKYFARAWRNYTSDPDILDIVKHCLIEFVSEPQQHKLPQQISFSRKETEWIHAEFHRFEEIGVIEKCTREEGDFISNFFLRDKKDGSFRVILNLKPLNKSVAYHHFKMDTRKTAARLLSKNCFMASVDLKDAYYSVSVAKEYRKYLRFFWDGQLFQFTTLPNGLACAPRLFTKLLKPVYATLRQEGHCCLGYIDDSFIVGDTWSACQTAVDSAVRLLTELGFQINLEKSVLTPTQTLTFLGYEFNSVDMTSRLTSEKRDLMKSHCNTILLSIQPTIREVAQVNGLMVAYSEGVEYGPLNYRCLEREKIAALRANRGNYDLTMSLSQESRCELKWWILNVDQAVKAISHGNPNLTVTSDASKLGWGAEFQGSTTGGRWTEAEACQHINQLELKAGFLALKSFCPHVSHTHIRLRMDNVTAVTYVNDMGGSHSPLCDMLARDIWQWCTSKGIWLTSSHIPGSLNELADKESRIFHDQTEWMLQSELFNKVVLVFGRPDIDLFASRLNKQLPRYVAWRPDPAAEDIDAFTVDWSDTYFYAFPPFSLLTRVLQKITEDKAEGIIIAPVWTTQPWFTQVMRACVQTPCLIPNTRDSLHLPFNKGAVHPLLLNRKLQLMACRLSGNPSRSAAFRRGLPTSYSRLGEQGRKNNIKSTFRNGCHTVTDGKWIFFNRL